MRGGTTRQLTIEINLAFKVRVMEDLHGDLLLGVVFSLEVGVVNRDILLQVPARQLDLLILTPAEPAHYSPVADCHRNTQKHQEEEIGLETTMVNDREYTLDDPWHDYDEGGKMYVVEGAIALGEAFNGSILDGWRVCGTDSEVRHRDANVQTFTTLPIPQHVLLLLPAQCFPKW